MIEWVVGVKVKVKQRLRIFFIFEKEKKRYEDQLGSQSEQQPFPGNGARKLVGYFNDAN